MPPDPTNLFLQRFLKQPQVPNRPINPNQLPPAQPMLPDWMRRGFEGGTDMILGALGVGPESQMNNVGQFLGMALPMARGRMLTPPIRQVQPSMDEVNMLVRQLEGNLANIPKSGSYSKPIYDEAGRLLAFEKQADKAYQAHVASSRNKNVMSRPKPEESLNDMFGREQFNKYVSRIK